MTPNTYEDELGFCHPSRYVVRPPTDESQGSSPIFMALHGFGMTASSFLEALSPLELPDAILVVPEGPYPVPPLRRGSEEMGYSWYVYRRDDPDSFLAELQRSEEHLVRVLDRVEERHSVDRSRSVLLGFSQGGYLAGYVGIRQRHRFGGLILASARLKHEVLAEELAAGNLPATLVIHSPADSLVPWPPQEESVRLLRKAGGNVEVLLHEDGHRLLPSACRLASQWMRRSNLVAPSSALS